jgi:hypothetical protein
MVKTIGTCGKCSGPVDVPVIWHGIYPPIPTCRHCGAHAKKAYGPVIDMADIPEPPKMRPWGNTGR